MHASLIHKFHPLRTVHFDLIDKQDPDLVFFMTRPTLSRPIRIPARPITLPKPTLLRLRTFASSLSKGPNMTHPAEERRSVEDLDRLLEIIRASTNRHILLEVF